MAGADIGATIASSIERVTERVAPKAADTEVLKLPRLSLLEDLPVPEVREAFARLSDLELQDVVDAIRRLPEKLPEIRPISVPADAPVPKAVVEALPFTEAQGSARRWLPLGAMLAVAAIGITIVTVGAWTLVRRQVRRGEGDAAGAYGGASEMAVGIPIEPESDTDATGFAADRGMTETPDSLAGIAEEMPDSRPGPGTWETEEIRPA
jgi:hypothetical protein